MNTLLVTAFCIYFLLPPSRVEREIVMSLRAPSTPRTEEQMDNETKDDIVAMVWAFIPFVLLIVVCWAMGWGRLN